MTQATTHRVLGTTRLRITHRTRYRFEEPLKSCRLRTYLQPQDTLSQRLVHHRIDVLPEARSKWQSHDDHGNLRTTFQLSGQLREVEVLATSTVELDRRPCPAVVIDGDWQTVAERSQRDRRFWGYLIPSVGIPSGPSIKTYAQVSFPDGCALGEGLLSLLDRLSRDFGPKATTLRAAASLLPKTTDLTSFTVACLRAVGLPTRYLSGYRLDTKPHQHAWASVWTGSDWLDVDPLRGRVGRLDHILLAQGRDAADIAPLNAKAQDAGRCRRETEIQIREPAFDALPFAESPASSAA
jgi:transglutaminase-like putative cysteine protease